MAPLKLLALLLVACAAPPHLAAQRSALQQPGAFEPATRDHPGIQAAIDSAAAAGGGTVFLGPGQWPVDRAPIGSYNRFAALTLRGKHITLRGAGPETVLSLGGDQDASTTIVVDVLPGAAHVRIADMSIDTSSATNTAEQTHAIATSGTCAGETCQPIVDLAIERVTFRHPNLPGHRKGDCVRLLGNAPETEVYRVRIVGNDLGDCARSAIGLQRGLHDVVIADNTIHCEGCDQAIDGEATGGGWDRGVLITGNTITSGAAAQGDYAIALTSTEGAVIAGNKMDRGIALYRTRNVVISNNVISGVARSGDGWVRVQNVCEGNVIEGNTIRREGAPGPAIALEPRIGALCGGAVVRGNAITQATAGQGIYAEALSRSSIGGNVITYPAPAPSMPAIHVRSTLAEAPVNALLIAGNVVHGQATYAITLEGIPGSFGQGVSLIGNVAVGTVFGLRVKNPTYFTSPIVMNGNTMGPGSHSGVTSTTGD